MSMETPDKKLKIIECPRDAMQGIRSWIPTKIKIHYIQQLLLVGFDTIDFGSFVSPKAVPQMRDTLSVYESLDLSMTSTKLLVIVVNERGAQEALQLDRIDYLGYPFSISETFQIRNTNSTIEESLKRVEWMQAQCEKHHKELVVYVSMGFGNPYGDTWNAEIVLQWVDRLYQLGIKILSLSDTIGVSTPDSITYLFDHVLEAYPQIEFGAHLHTTPTKWLEKIKAAYASGCRRFDGALMGFGGCPMAKDELTGNMPTERMVSYFRDQGIQTSLQYERLNDALKMTTTVF